jgi:non-canonical poly(A) RNA polymerase PAPD5/7
MDFNYVTTGISVRNDGFYFAKGEREKKSIFWQPNRPFSLAVENPLETTMDVGAGAFRMNMIQRIFEHAFKTFMAYVAEPREHTDSILATIIPPTEEMVKRMALKVEDNAEEDVGSKSSANNGDGNNQNNISRKKHKADRRDSGGSRGSKKGKNKKRSSK